MENFQAMENFVSHKGKVKIISTRRSPEDGLSCVIKFFLDVYCLLLAFMIVSSCGSRIETGRMPEEEGTAATRADTIRTVICTKTAWTDDMTPPLRKLDIFIYGYDGLRKLESHTALSGDGTERRDTVRCTAGRKTIVAIANSPMGFNLTALAKMDGMELVSYRAADDDASAPVMSASADAEAGETVCLELKPLLCRVRLAEISNTMPGYRLLEEPVAFLTDCNPYAEILRQKDFRPKEMSADTLRQPLPYDIGVFTQHPRTELFCYPNDTPENMLGSPRTIFGLECRIDGEKTVFECPLPPLGRAGSVDVAICVDGPDSWTCSVW